VREGTKKARGKGRLYKTTGWSEAAGNKKGVDNRRKEISVQNEPKWRPIGILLNEGNKN